MIAYTNSDRVVAGTGGSDYIGGTTGGSSSTTSSNDAAIASSTVTVILAGGGTGFAIYKYPQVFLTIIRKLGGIIIRT